MSVDAIRPTILRLHGLPPAPAIDVAEVPAAPAGLSGYFGMSRRRFRTLLGGLLALFLLLVLWRNIFIPIGSGNAGVLWSRFDGGTVMGRRYDEGEHVVWPWDQMTVYDLRLQEMHGAVPLLTSDGLQVSMRVTVRYAPRPNALTVLHRDVGPGYRATVVWPDMVAAARHIVRQFKPEDLSVVGEAELAARVEAAARSAVARHWVTLDRVLITEITLPPRVQAQIQEKLADEQKALAGPFLLRQAELKRQAWAIEAEGVRAFQRRAGVSLVKWRSVDAMDKLAQSPNSKIVVLGGGGNSPLLLDTGRDDSGAVGQAKRVEK